MEQLHFPEIDFSAVPPSRRRSPGRVKSVPARLYIDRFEEHRQAYQFLQRVQKLHGAGTKTLVRALLHWRDTVAEPLEKSRDKDGRLRVPDGLLFAVTDFTPIDGRGNRIKHISARLYIDKWIEHREAYEFIQRQQRLHGEGNKTIVRAVLHYRDAVNAAGKAARS
jgi:hypothetical protein